MEKTIKERYEEMWKIVSELDKDQRNDLLMQLFGWCEAGENEHFVRGLEVMARKMVK